MRSYQLHTFHIPVMGLAYTIDTPLKVARFGISSVISIVEDNIIEQMRKYHCEQWGEKYIPVLDSETDHRAIRITEYLNLLKRIVTKQLNKLREEAFEEGNEIVKYFRMLPEKSTLKQLFNKMGELHEGREKQLLQDELREYIAAGSIDVNIMTKCDRMNDDKEGNPLTAEFADAMSALRGFAMSDVVSSVIFSAGLNPRLYTYCESFPDFFPTREGLPKKKIILKVSDYRSALIQGKFFAKKGLLISEFRIESGLNCGGHAFTSEGMLSGPILQEFTAKRNELTAELLKLCNESLNAKGKPLFPTSTEIKITYQGGIGTSGENDFLQTHYGLDGTGWGSPFLLVPDVTNVDEETLHLLATAEKEDFFLSDASPLGVPFNNFSKSSSEKQRKLRIEKGRPGSPCYKKFLAFNTEFTAGSICTASREYQDKKIKQLKEKDLPIGKYNDQLKDIESKDCLCEGLGSAALLKNSIPVKNKLTAVTICPGPNLAYFSGVFTLENMVNHIYGRNNLQNLLKRSNMFINELSLNIDYLKKEVKKNVEELSEKQVRYFNSCKKNLLDGIEYYKELIPSMKFEAENYLHNFSSELQRFELHLFNLQIPQPVLK